jgi:hypothetical protein
MGDAESVSHPAQHDDGYGGTDSNRLAFHQMNARWPADKVPGANQGLTETKATLLERLQRRLHALNKRERDQLTKLLRKTVR